METLAQELRRCKDECRSIEGMRRTALDSLRSLEEEVVELQEKELQLTEALEELDELKTQVRKEQKKLLCQKSVYFIFLTCINNKIMVGLYDLSYWL